MGFTDRLKHAWDVFLNKDPTRDRAFYGSGYSMNPDRIRFTRGNEKTVVTAIYNRIALDCAAIEIEHVELDHNERYIKTIDSKLNNCLTIEANVDQTGRAFRHDVVASMLDEGVIAIVPTVYSSDPFKGTFDVDTMRVGKIIEWFPKAVRVRVYDENSGMHKEIVMPKALVCIVENPFYAVMNEHGSVASRLLRKLSLLDSVDEQSSSGKLDLIIQLPYIVKSEARKIQANNRRKEIEQQLTSSKYGIAYTDGTEKITQLNRSLENNLMAQVQYLQELMYSQFGITQSIMDGTANEETMTNYYSRTIEPIMAAITDEIKRKFLTKTARSQRKSILYFKDPFKLVPVSSIPDLADKLTRNEVMSSNEIRQIMGMKPSNDPGADELRNKNINQAKEDEMGGLGGLPIQAPEALDGTEKETLDGFDEQIAELERMLGGD